MSNPRAKNINERRVLYTWDDIAKDYVAWDAVAGSEMIKIARGDKPGYSIVHKFGAGVLTANPLPISPDGVYKTPTSAVALEVLSTSANDTSAGTGAQQITIQGLDSSWQPVSQTVELNGTTPVTLGTDLIRLNRWFVSRLGTYCDQNTGAHEGTLTIREVGGGAGTTWSTIGVTPLAFGQSQIGCYTVPLGFTGYLLSKSIFVDTTKTADIFFFQRPEADDVIVPYTGAMRLVEREVGVQGGFNLELKVPKGPFVGPCDLGFLGTVSSGSPDVSVEFELLLIEDGF